MSSIVCEIRFIPLNQLVRSAKNVNKTNRKNRITQLAALIRANGLTGFLNVESNDSRGDEPPTYGVVAGERRRLALERLVKSGDIAANFEVPCRVIEARSATSISLAENSEREALHPADEFDAFRKLVDEGRDIEDVAAAFSVSPLVVKQRLKLARVAPELIAEYRKGEATLQQLMACTIADDHQKQIEVWNSIPETARTPQALRQALTAQAHSVNDPIAKFVRKEYGKAGGPIHSDLFDPDNGYLLDLDLVDQLVSKKLNRAAERVRAEGFAWVDVARHFSDSNCAYREARVVDREPNEEEQALARSLEEQRENLERQAEERDASGETFEDIEDGLRDLDRQDREFAESLEIVVAEEKPLAGAVVAIASNGLLEIRRNLLRVDDANRLRQKATPRAEMQPRKKGVHSAALLQRLSAHRTLALQYHLACNPHVALAALTHSFLGRVVPLFHDSNSILDANVNASALQGYESILRDSPAQLALNAHREKLLKVLPSDDSEVLSWLIGQPQSVLLELLAYCVARSARDIQSREDERRDGAVLEEATALDMRNWWGATANNYLTCVSNAHILDVLKEYVPSDQLASLRSLSKQALIPEAERILTANSWLPAILKPASESTLVGVDDTHDDAEDASDYQDADEVETVEASQVHDL